MDAKKESTADAVREHGNQLARNLVYLKKFLSAQQEQSDKIQKEALRAARWSAFAATMAAVAAIAQIFVLLL